MNEKEFNGLILAELVKIANDVFTNEIEIAPGTYTAAELAKLKDANGNEINIKYLCVDAQLNITDFRTVQINSFKCSFPVDQVFNLVWQFEKLIGTKQANKTRFTKIEERENIVCSFDIWITKEHLNITKLVTKDSLRPAFNYIYLDPYKSALVASDGRTLKEYPVIIETSGLLPDSLKLFINPKHLKEMVGRCSVCVCNQEGGNITEITNDKKQTFVCDFAGYFPNYRLVYPNLSKDGFIKIQKSELKAVACFVKEIAKRNKKSGFSLRTIAGENKVYLSYNDADSNGHKELCVTLEKAALIDIKLGFFALNVIPLLPGWTGGVWLVAPDRAVVFDDKMARIGVVMPAFINDSICPNYYGDMFGEQSDQRQMQMNYFGEISDVFTPKVIIESETEQKRQTNLNYSHFKRIITYINESLWKRINKPKEVIAETNRLRKVRSMLLDWILIWLILSESNRT